MVKIIKYFIIIILFPSCCDYYTTSKGGLRSKNKYKKFLKKRISPSFMGIDTSHVYKMLNIKLSEEDNRVKEIPRTSNNAYLTFKNNGSVYFFHGILKGSTEKVLDLDKANIGFLVKFNNKNYLASYSPINCGSFSVNDFKVNGDTLAISAGSNKGHRIWYYYIKKDMDSPVNQIDW